MRMGKKRFFFGNQHINSIKRNGLFFSSYKFLDWLHSKTSKTNSQIKSYMLHSLSHQLKILLACFNCTKSAKCTQCTGITSPHQLYCEHKSFFTTYNPKKVAKNHVKVSCSNLYAQYSWYTQKQSVLQI